MRFFTGVRTQLILSSLIGTGALLATIALLGSSGWLISAASLQPPVMTLEIAIVAVRTFGLSRSLLRYSERLASHKAAFSALTEIRARVFDAMERVAPSGVVSFGRGDLLSRVVSDVDKLADFPLRVFVPVVSGALTILVTSIATWFILPAAGFLFFSVLVLSAFVMSILVVRGHARSEFELAPLQGELAQSTLNVFDGITEIAALGLEQQALLELEEIDRQLVNRTITNVRAQSFGQSFSLLAQGAAVVGAVLLGAHALATQSLDGRVLAVLILIPLASFEAVSSIPQALVTALDLQPSVRRIDEILSQPSTVPDSGISQTVEFTDEISLTNISASWSLGNAQGITDASLKISPARIIGVVGPSGSGKSTLAAVLVRFIEPRSGNYTIDGTDVHEFVNDDVRGVVGLFDSTQHIFSTSIIENLRIANPQLTAIEAQALLDLVQLDTWSRGLAAGLDTILGDRGAPMSGGERQRLLLARSIAGTHSVLVLDEPTEFLDHESAQHIIELIRQEAITRSIVLITHRLSDLEGVEQITVINQGRTLTQESFERLVTTNEYFATSIADERAAAKALQHHK